MLLCALLGAALFSATGAQAKNGLFKVSLKGTQDLTWSTNGTTSSCEVRRDAGSGEAKFSFKSSKAPLIYVDSKGKIVGTVNTKANGSISGNFGETTVTPCDGFAPQDPFSADASGCGSRSFAMPVNFKTFGAFQWITSGAINYVGDNCPFPIDNSLLLSSDLTQCGDSNNTNKRSWGIAAHEGQGLIASKFHVSTKRLLKLRKGRSKQITGKDTVDCTPEAAYWSGGVHLQGVVKYTFTFKRAD